jgi:hypothetical protein
LFFKLGEFDFDKIEGLFFFLKTDFFFLFAFIIYL